MAIDPNLFLKRSKWSISKGKLFKFMLNFLDLTPARIKSALLLLKPSGGSFFCNEVADELTHLNLKALNYPVNFISSLAVPGWCPSENMLKQIGLTGIRRVRFVATECWTGGWITNLTFVFRIFGQDMEEPKVFRSPPE